MRYFGLTAESSQAILAFVFIVNRGTIVYRSIGIHHETDISAQQEQAKTNARFSGSHEHP
ncbi:protein of unknown function [Candidatus Methylomirabilis oxygeniifera]|uniref:Uncharacterized protein n=1 Tax=Methylomirabilis oxygeniifera TaxID=671143 RepID=D5MLW5_METO1|nr:protein of unknown function [Candidatus Methylomirabilis oxyfera]